MAGKTLYQKYAASLPVLPQNEKIFLLRRAAFAIADF